MCGIVGVVGQSEAAPIIFKALKKLEYRGYDSAGIATTVNNHLEIRKAIGKLDEVELACHLSQLPGFCGVGHVRWATHGKVTAENAHPHYDCTHSFAIVHNGIIENFQELRAGLNSQHKFVSDTDTEVIAHMIEDEINASLSRDSQPYEATPSESQPHSFSQSFMVQAGEKPGETRKLGTDPSLESALFRVCQRLKGSYAILVVSSLDPGKIVAARKESPLVIGLGSGRNFIASDVLCFVDQTNLAVYLEDSELAVLTSNSVHIFDKNFHPVNRAPMILDNVSYEINKGEHDFFMMKEILEQPQSIRQALEQDPQLMMDIAIEMLRAKQVVLTGCGTSRNAALIGRYVFSKLAGIFSEVVLGSEFQYFSDSVDKNTVVIAVSQSGETADVIQGVKVAKKNGAKVFSVVNSPGSTLSRLSDHAIDLKCGPEIAVAATKSFISELTVFYLLAFAMQNRQAEGIKKMLPLAGLIQDNLKHNSQDIAELAEKLKDKRDFYFLGRGINYAIAGEGALKLKEIAYIHAEGMAAGELKHGTLALIEHGTPVIALCPNDYTHDETLSNIMETKARGAYIIGVSDKNNPAFDAWIYIPAVEEIFYPVVSIIPLQMLAYYSAIARGFDPDKPRNLAKSVTVK